MSTTLRRSALALACASALLVAAGGGRSATAGGAATTPCRPALSMGVLPVWARTGFSDPRPRMPHVIGRRGDIAAVIFGYPLLYPESKIRANKVLWVSRVHQRPLDDLYIRAQRMNGTHPVGRPVSRRIANGPGPSYVNLPAAGCWRLTLHWSGHADQLDLRYRPLRG
jgi:hypothetical protein